MIFKETLRDVLAIGGMKRGSNSNDNQVSLFSIPVPRIWCMTIDYYSDSSIHTFLWKDLRSNVVGGPAHADRLGIAERASVNGLY
jgi:hypothetical protein